MDKGSIKDYEEFYNKVSVEFGRVYERFRGEEIKLKELVFKDANSSSFDNGFLNGLWIMCSEFCEALRTMDCEELTGIMNDIDKQIENEVSDN